MHARRRWACSRAPRSANSRLTPAASAADARTDSAPSRSCSAWPRFSRTASRSDRSFSRRPRTTRCSSSSDSRAWTVGSSQRSGARGLPLRAARRESRDAPEAPVAPAAAGRRSPSPTPPSTSPAESHGWSRAIAATRARAPAAMSAAARARGAGAPSRASPSGLRSHSRRSLIDPTRSSWVASFRAPSSASPSRRRSSSFRRCRRSASREVASRTPATAVARASSRDSPSGSGAPCSPASGRRRASAPVSDAWASAKEVRASASSRSWRTSSWRRLARSRISRRSPSRSSTRTGTSASCASSPLASAAAASRSCCADRSSSVKRWICSLMSSGVSPSPGAKVAPSCSRARSVAAASTSSRSRSPEALRWLATWARAISLSRSTSRCSSAELSLALVLAARRASCALLSRFAWPWPRVSWAGEANAFAARSRSRPPASSWKSSWARVRSPSPPLRRLRSPKPVMCFAASGNAPWRAGVQSVRPACRKTSRAAPSTSQVAATRTSRSSSGQARARMLRARVLLPEALGPTRRVSPPSSSSAGSPVVSPGACCRSSRRTLMR